MPKENNALTEELERTINIKILKEFVLKLPVSSMVRRIILQEDDFVSTMSFIEKIGIWMKIIREENED